MADYLTVVTEERNKQIHPVAWLTINMLKYLVYILTTWDGSVNEGNVSATLYNDAVESSARTD